MKHPPTLRLRCLAAMAIAAVAPLAAQAQTSTLSIVVGPEPVVEPEITCDDPANGKLIAMAYGGKATTRKGEVALFTTDINESGISQDLSAQVDTGEDTSPNATEPGLNFGWSYGSTTATQFVRLTATVPLNAIQSTITGLQTATSAAFALPATIATEGNGATSHVYLKGLDALAGTGASVSQTWNTTNNTLTVDIKRGSDGTLSGRTAVRTNLDITLQSPNGVHLKKQTSATTLNIDWTCSRVAYSG